ncbi:hypothetical protein E4T80_11910 [Muribacter muris]|uniref:Uncharacterized protein n=1 Tax=Muribacter muris TaxID=67855 RepID=A0A4Y9JSK3_9PAST|nr:hypothetical protein [Muribacter muris]MBF0786166.1 hypothetical protein [Muribacter muris]MBF0828303.1 hypothetical protein [Muribacter muris]TFV07690.1 hypothetical protein E4T80_11910 [Muribacter muris]
MLENNRWIPEVTRPTLDKQDAFTAFLKSWVANKYQDEIQEHINDWLEEGEEFDIEEFGIYQDILAQWNGDNEDTAECLIKWQGWSYADAKEFEEKCLSLDIDKHEKKVSEDWIKTHGYELPFPVGSKVKWRKYEGIIQEDPDNYYFPQGLVCVLTDEMTAENKRNAENGLSHRRGGYIAKWEELEFISIA